MPPRRPSPVGAHVPTSGTPSGVLYAERVGAQAIQLFASNPRGWALPRPDDAADARFAQACRDRRMPVFVHAPYLVNLASPSEVTRTKSVESLRHALARAARLGAHGVVVHAGAAVDAVNYDRALVGMRELLLPLLDGIGDAGPMLLLEPSAGGGRPMAATVEELGPLVAAVEDHPRLGVCIDTCHAYAAGHDLAQPGGIRRVLTALVRTVGAGRLRLVHANDSRDPLGSRRDRHAAIGSGSIGEDAFAELFRHPATRDVPVIVETSGSTDDIARDIATLKRLRDS